MLPRLVELGILSFLVETRQFPNTPLIRYPHD